MTRPDSACGPAAGPDLPKLASRPGSTPPEPLECWSAGGPGPSVF
uniref:Uncharacterized protein n=1 Tax=Anguilla anguilla TaxID=7936 RepID=A0A0E9WH65_ANGAN